MKKSPLLLKGQPLSLEDVRDVAFLGRKVSLHTSAKKKIDRAYQYLKKEMATGKTIYGVNTGFGVLSSVKISDLELETLQVNLLRSHAVGTGKIIARHLARAMMLLRAQSLAQGHSGVRVAVVEQIIQLINAGITPQIPEQGSVGASGDLAPLSHLALVLIGEGSVEYRGKTMPSARALKAARIRPLKLGPKEGLALINGTQFMTAIGTFACLEAEYLTRVADLAGAMTTEALRGTETAFEAEIQSVRPHPGQIETARHLKSLLMNGRVKSEISLSHENCGKVQDPYSVRCMPQVHGATRDCLRFVRDVLEREANSVTDNPLIFPREKKILSGGNFHGQIVAISLDLLAIAAAELASISEQRIEKLVNPVISELPAFLVREGGVNSGFMIVQVAAASIVSENKTLCHPASVDSIPTSADKEDHVSMGAWASRKAMRVVKNAQRVLAMELLAAAQGIDLLRPLKSSLAIEKAHSVIRTKVKRLDSDRLMKTDIDHATSLIQERKFDV